MQFANRLRLIGAFCLAALCVVAVCARAQPEPHEEFTCTSGAVTRLISIFNLSAPQGQPGACRVRLHQGWENQYSVVSEERYPYCVQKALSLVTKLTESNYSCRPEAKERPGANRAD